VQTWQDIKDFFFPAVQDTEAYQSFFTVAQALAWANSGLWEIAQYTQFLDTVQAQNTVTNTVKYQLGATGAPPMGVWRVEIDDEKIRAVTAEELARSDRRWQKRSNRPYFYYLDYANTTPDQFYIRLWETPNGVYSLRTYSYGVPAQVSESANTDKLQVPQWAIYAVLWYMLSEAYLAETRRQNFETSSFYRMLFEDTIERVMERTNTKINKSWVVGEEVYDPTANFWDNIPQTIPEPA
jgi:hypothetical protein